MPRDNRCMYRAHVCFYVCCSDCVGVCGNVCCVAVVVKNSVFFSLGVLRYVVCLCRRCDGWCVFCLYCEALLTFGFIDFIDIVPLPLTSSWCTTWFALSRHWRLVEVRSLDNFLIVCHALRLLEVRSVDVMTSSHFFSFLLFHCVDQLCSSLQCTFA